MATNKQYDLSYTSGALISDYFDAVMNEIKDFDQFVNGEEVIHHSIVAVNSESSQKRYTRELNKRIKKLTKPIFKYYFVTNGKGKKIIQFYTICKTYPIIAEFMIEVVRDKWLNLNFNLEPYDFKSYLTDKLEKTNSLDRITETTQNKLVQVYFKMMRELGMHSDGKLCLIKMDPVLMQLFYKAGDEWFIDAMLQSEDDKKQMRV